MCSVMNIIIASSSQQLLCIIAVSLSLLAILSLHHNYIIQPLPLVMSRTHITYLKFYFYYINIAQYIVIT